MDKQLHYLSNRCLFVLMFMNALLTALMTSKFVIIFLMLIEVRLIIGVNQIIWCKIKPFNW